MEKVHLFLLILLASSALMTQSDKMPAFLDEISDDVDQDSTDITDDTSISIVTFTTDIPIQDDIHISESDPAVILMICIFLAYLIFATAVIVYLIYVFCYDLTNLDALNKDTRQQFGLPEQTGSHNEDEFNTPASQKSNKLKK